MTHVLRVLPHAVGLVFLTTISLASLASQAPSAPAFSSPWWLEPGDPRVYIGARACADCHDEEHEQWAASLHVQMTRPIDQARVHGDFSSGTRLEANGRRFRMDTRDARRFIAVSHGGRPFEEFEVQYTLGALRVQGYLSTLPDGRVYVLPAFWHVGERRWIDWKEITPVPDSDHDLRQIWNVNCFNCHATNLARNFDVATRRFQTTWSEMGVTCEACHGPGKAHADLMEKWEKEAARRGSRQEERGTPVAPGTRSQRLKIFAAKSATRRQVFDLCGYCHGNKNNVFTGFLPGDRYEDYAVPFLASQPPPPDDPQGDYWPDARPSRFNRPQALTLSGCFIKGDATCTNCHVAHGSPYAHSLKVPIDRSDELCTQCHKDKGYGLRAAGYGSDISPSALLAGLEPGRAVPQRSALDFGLWLETTGKRQLAQRPKSNVQSPIDPHTRHAADSEGSRCINCHMSNVNWRLLIRRRDHTFQPPVPEITAKYGAPNACTECHDDRPPEWAGAWLDRWYGSGDRDRRARALLVADGLYGAADRDPAALPRLAALLSDRTRGALVRASAADALGRLLTEPGRSAGTTESQTSFADEARRKAVTAVARQAPAAPTSEAPAPADRAVLVNALIGGAADPEPMVRATATRALGLVADPRTSAVLVARLSDAARVVRVNAAEALLNLGIVRLEGSAGLALTQAQDEYASSLQTFPDRPSDHVSLGWLEMQRGREAQATAALDRALALDSGQLRAQVLLGIIDARRERFADALARWREVKRANPAYPNIDRLIEEAERRRTP